MITVRKFIIGRTLISLYLLVLWWKIFSARHLLYLDPLSPKRRLQLLEPIIGQLSSWSITTMFILGLAGGAGLLFSRTQRAAAALSYICLLFFIHANALVHEVSTQYIGWTLILFVILPGFKWNYESESELKIARDWATTATWAVIFAIGGAYTFMGFSKLAYPAWHSHRLVPRLFHLTQNNPGAIPFPLPPLFLHSPLSLSAALVEFLALPMLLLRQTNFAAIILLSLLMTFIGLGLGFYYIAAFMMIVHLLLLRPEPTGPG